MFKYYKNQMYVYKWEEEIGLIGWSLIAGYGCDSRRKRGQEREDLGREGNNF